MPIGKVSNPADIAITGLKVQATRMNILAANIANANTTRTADGKPYQRQDIVVHSTGGGITGVDLSRIVNDTTTESRRVLQPGHPDADASGYVTMPNVEIPVEMMNMVTATRAYQANAAVLKRYQDLTDATLELIR
jgi:flagellar basal-body rod protein FlgC